MTDLKLPWTLSPEHSEVAVMLLETYFARGPGATFTGAHFERFAGGGDAPAVSHRFTSEDLTAVTMLSVDVPATAALQIIEGPLRATLHELLRQIPTDMELVDVDPRSITPEWPAWRLWTALRRLDGLGPTTVSKLLARKRPRLLPVFDSFVERELRLVDGALWAPLAAALRRDNTQLHRHLLALRDEARIGHDISPLRVFDVVVWRTARGDAGRPNGLPDPRNDLPAT